jgi:hypothetical protein
MAERKRSDRDVKEELERILEENERLAEQAHQQGQAFSAPSPEELEKKLRGETSNSPIITGQGWTSTVPLGGNSNYTVYLKNPDPSGYGYVMVSYFVGSVNFFDSPADMVIARDQRFGQFGNAGLYLAPNGGTGSVSYVLPVPTTVPKTTYYGNALVWLADLHDKGTYVDRALAWITVT